MSIENLKLTEKIQVIKILKQVLKLFERSTQLNTPFKIKKKINKEKTLAQSQRN